LKLDVYKIDGTLTGEKLNLPEKIFNIKPNDHAVWLTATAEMTNRRQGTSATKNRSEVKGGGRKPWRQKGRGTARAGTIRSPLWVGGGRVFGPTPKNFSKKVTKKMNRLARKSVLSYKAKDDKIKLIEDFSFESPKTSQMVDILKQLHIDAIKILLLVPQTNRDLWLSCRNVSFLSVKEAACFSVHDVLGADLLLVQKSALKKIEEVLKK
jgi:large subunit ribosomal protein L4